MKSQKINQILNNTNIHLNILLGFSAIGVSLE